MLPICYICLRSNPKLGTLSDDLENFYEELCDYYDEAMGSPEPPPYSPPSTPVRREARDEAMGSPEPPPYSPPSTPVRREARRENDIQFCAECTRILQKFYDFKKKCEFAVKTLQTWRKQKPREKCSIYVLHTRIPNPHSQLSLCNKNKVKVYYYHQQEEETTPIQISSSHPHIITVNITSHIENNEIKEENYIKHENEYIVVGENLNIDIERTAVEKSDEESFKDDKSVNFSDSDSDSNISLNKLIKIKSNKIKTVSKIKRQKVKPPNREEFKRYLKDKFENEGVVKDNQGKDIDINIILNSLDKIANVNWFKKIRSLCTGPGQLKPLAIQKLSELQAHFTEYDDFFSTEFLTDQAQVQAEFERRREFSNYARLKQYRCEKCIRGFVNEKLLENHNETQHDESYKFECTLCRTRHKTEQMLSRHNTRHRVVYKCKLCTDFVTSNRPAMIAHYHKHKGVKYKCEHCGLQFTNKASLYAHYNEKCLKISKCKHICKLCARAFSKETGLKQHCYIKHKNEEFISSAENVKCDTCNIIFINNEVYLQHVHISHKNSEAKGKRFTCRLCKDVGNNSLWLAKHFSREHPAEDVYTVYKRKRYLCDHCGKVFCNASLYNDHKNTHTSLRPYSCPTCNKRYATKANLRVHIESHNPPSRECRRCGKLFATASGLHRHVKSHIGDRRYICEICSKGFTHSDSLKAHVNGVHYNIRPVRKRKRDVSDE